MKLKRNQCKSFNEKHVMYQDYIILVQLCIGVVLCYFSVFIMRDIYWSFHDSCLAHPRVCWPSWRTYIHCHSFMLSYKVTKYVETNIALLENVKHSSPAAFPWWWRAPRTSGVIQTMTREECSSCTSPWCNSRPMLSLKPQTKTRDLKQRQQHVVIRKLSGCFVRVFEEWK